MELLIWVLGIIIVIAIVYAILVRAIPALPPGFQPWAWIAALVVLLIIFIEVYPWGAGFSLPSLRPPGLR